MVAPLSTEKKKRDALIKARDEAMSTRAFEAYLTGKSLPEPNKSDGGEPEVLPNPVKHATFLKHSAKQRNQWRAQLQAAESAEDMEAQLQELYEAFLEDAAFLNEIWKQYFGNDTEN